MKHQMQIRTNRRSGLPACLIMFTAALIGTQDLHAELNPEYSAKLACLYKLASYVEHAGRDDQPRVRIGVLGRDPFGRALDSMAANRKPHGKSVVVSRFRAPDEYTACDILFISREVEIETLRQLARRTRKQCVLIVGEHPQLTANGGVVNLTIKDDGKAAIQLNLDAAHARGLMIDARLLRVCQIVDPGASTR